MAAAVREHGNGKTDLARAVSLLLQGYAPWPTASSRWRRYPARRSWFRRYGSFCRFAAGPSDPW